MSRAGALRGLAVAGWVVLAIPPVLYAVLTLYFSIRAFAFTGVEVNLGMVTAVVMLLAVGGGAYKYAQRDLLQGWYLMGLAWVPPLLSVLWGVMGA